MTSTLTPPAPPIPPEERVLDWRSYHDPRSLEFPIRRLMASPEIRPKAWRLGAVLDQGREGACVGFGHTADLLASPRPAPLTTSLTGSVYAVDVYHQAQTLDDIPGTAYEGTSVLAGAKVMVERGFIASYRWAFSTADIRDAILSQGPVVIGIPWYSDMYATQPNGVVTVGGTLVGGHCLLVYGYHPAMRIPHEGPSTSRYEVFQWRNSWGPSYGRNGSAIIHSRDLDDLLDDQGEACVALGRSQVRPTDLSLNPPAA